ncbi:MAG TPA: aminotransferase class III-fold pyridoxal phosphate-dependent enzyme [Candidatus Acidoferrales bacterium]|nr:aminotransferase class III-fold pyridoxal phosphate-dependent enzyme [Candidatus Acidoferrales bacterium]
MEQSLNPTLGRLLALCRMDRGWVRGQGVWLFDRDGRRFLDCYAQYGAVMLGHNAPCVKDAVRAALDEDEPAMVQPFRARHAEELANALCGLAPGNLSRCVFASTGAEAVEAALKLVRARTGRPLILSATGSFHGKTLAALALTGQPHHGEGFGPLPRGFEHVEFGDADALEKRLRADAHKIAAFFLEPIQGERGVHLPPPGYLRRVRELCSRYGVALVLDEIQTGLGRTGKLFACEHDDVAPDVMVLGKGLGGGLFPLSACLASAEMWDEGFALRHSSTFANNNVACRVGLAVLEHLISGGVCADVARKGERLNARLAELAGRHPRTIDAVRGRGLMSAIEFRPLAERGALLSLLAHQGLYAYAVAGTIAELASVLVLPTLGETSVLRIAPALTIGDRELDAAIEGIESVIELLDRNPTQTIVRALGALDGSKVACAAVATKPHVITPRVRSDTPRPDFAFIVHYTSIEDVLATDPDLIGLSPHQLTRFCDFAYTAGPGVLMRTPAIRSATGATAHGLILALPLLPREMARQGRRRVSQQIAQLVDLGARLGARVVGLGGYTTPYSRRGCEVVGRGPAITTGNPLTAGMACLATRRLLDREGRAIEDTRVAVIGAAGSVGGLCARLMAREHPRSLLLIGNPARGVEHLARLGGEVEREFGARVEAAADFGQLANCDVVITATAAGCPVLDRVPLATGTIICDVARPPDTSAQLRARHDLRVIEGGRVALPDTTMRFGVGNLQNLPDGVTLACLAETILLALEGDFRNSGIGDDVPLSDVDRALALAARHGFKLASLNTHSKPAADESVATLSMA